MKRRFFLQSVAAASGAAIAGKMLGGCQMSGQMSGTESSAMAEMTWRMPDEAAPHECTWMAFGASERVWGSEFLSYVQDNLATIARAIAQYEPVKMLVRETDRAIAAEKCGPEVELIVCPLDDLWMRDTGPVFAIAPDGEKVAIDFNFNGWGEKQTYKYDGEVAQFVAQQAQARRIQANLVMEGGGIEVDGRGTALVTESCIVNANRNPGLSKADCEAELKALLGLRKIIWLPGIAGQDITDGHIDFYARFAQPGVVVAGFDPDPQSFDHAVTKRHLEILQSATDADGQKLEIVVLEGPRKIRPGFDPEEFAAGYINFYLVNGAAIAPEFGDDKADQRARDVLADLFPDRDIMQLNIDEIAAGGGGIHCTTQQEPLVEIAS